MKQYIPADIEDQVNQKVAHFLNHSVLHAFGYGPIFFGPITISSMIAQVTDNIIKGAFIGGFAAAVSFRVCAELTQFVLNQIIKRQIEKFIAGKILTREDDNEDSAPPEDYMVYSEEVKREILKNQLEPIKKHNLSSGAFIYTLGGLIFSASNLAGSGSRAIAKAFLGEGLTTEMIGFSSEIVTNFFLTGWLIPRLAKAMGTSLPHDLGIVNITGLSAGSVMGTLQATKLVPYSPTSMTGITLRASAAAAGAMIGGANQVQRGLSKVLCCFNGGIFCNPFKTAAPTGYQSIQQGGDLEAASAEIQERPTSSIRHFFCGR